MKFKLIAILVIAFLLCTVASAQSYSVRVTHNTNLRASYSLDARIVDSAAAGTTLTVTGSRDMWLMIDRSGREVWMADWVPMTRVEGGPVSADINNCCFVDRQCASDQEWTAGYWAFQNNQCGAPIAPVSSVSTPTSATDPADVNNCCFTGWQCHSQTDWEAGYHAFQTNQCKHRGLAIEGPDSFVALLHNTLDVIQDRSPDWYGYIISGLSKILYDPGAQRSAVYIGSGTWHVPPSRADSWANAVSVGIVGSLAHEACHVHQHIAGQVLSALVEERACLETQIAAARAVYPTGSQGYINWATNLLANIDDPAFQWWH